MDITPLNTRITLYTKLASNICALLMFLLCVWGVLTNIIGMWIFSRPRMRRLSINVLLFTLCSVDALLLFLAMPVFAAAPIMTHVPINVQWLILKVYPLALTFQVCYT